MLRLSKGKEKQFSHSITLLLPYYLGDSFRLLFEALGFSVIHSEKRDMLEQAIRSTPIDIALEWQHGREDYSIRDLLRKYNKRVPILLLLNWNGYLPPDFPNLGYIDYLDVPWAMDELMSKFHRALPESKRPILRVIWKGRKRKRASSQ
jgi:hypothetical protein